MPRRCYRLDTLNSSGLSWLKLIKPNSIANSLPHASCCFLFWAVYFFHPFVSEEIRAEKRQPQQLLDFLPGLWRALKNTITTIGSSFTIYIWLTGLRDGLDQVEWRLPNDRHQTIEFVYGQGSSKSQLSSRRSAWSWGSTSRQDRRMKQTPQVDVIR